MSETNGANVEVPEIDARVLQAARDQVLCEMRVLQDRIRQQRKELKAQGRAIQLAHHAKREAYEARDRHWKSAIDAGRMISRLTQEIRDIKGWDFIECARWMGTLKP